MKNLIAALLCIALLSAAAGAQTAPAATDVERNLRSHIASLTSDKLAGRRTGEAGATLASEYVARQFQKLRLKTAAGNTFYQPFPYLTGVARAASGNEFRLSGTAAAVPASDVAAVGFSPNAKAGDTSVVFAGFGIVSTEQSRDDYAGVDAKGKIVMVLDGNPENDNPHSLLGRFDVRTKALIARDKGAVAILVVSREADFASEKLAQMKFDQTLGEAALPTLVIARSAAKAILAASDSELASLETGTSRRQDAATGATAAFEIRIEKKMGDARNVIGVLEGNDPILKNEVIVVGAHYDHLGRGGQGSLDVNSSDIHPGADDNASGTAAMIELARKFAAARNNKRTIVFAAFSGEEEGLIGSQFYVSNPLRPLEKTVAMINLDMIGRAKNQALTIGGVGTAGDFKTLVQTINEPSPAASSSGAALQPPRFQLRLNEDGFGPSDHSSFYGRKIPVLFFFTGVHNDYHKPSDTAEKINYAAAAGVVAYVSEIVQAIDQNPARPTYAAAKSGGMSGGRAGFNISLGTVPNYADSTDGLLLDGVRENSPAAKAGVQAGDKVVSLAGREIRNVMDYTYALGEMKAGQEYEIVVSRGGNRVAFKIVPVKR